MPAVKIPSLRARSMAAGKARFTSANGVRRTNRANAATGVKVGNTTVRANGKTSSMASAVQRANAGIGNKNVRSAVNQAMDARFGEHRGVDKEGKRVRRNASGNYGGASGPKGANTRAWIGNGMLKSRDAQGNVRSEPLNSAMNRMKLGGAITRNQAGALARGMAGKATG